MKKRYKSKIATNIDFESDKIIVLLEDGREFFCPFGMVFKTEKCNFRSIEKLSVYRRWRRNPLGRIT